MTDDRVKVSHISAVMHKPCFHTVPLLTFHQRSVVEEFWVVRVASSYQPVRARVKDVTKSTFVNPRTAYDDIDVDPNSCIAYRSPCRSKQ